MPCNCKKTNTVLQDTTDPLQWGPILWKYLHSLAEHLGFSGNSIVDTDQANYMETVMTTLHSIIPCKECQAHTASYIAANPFQIKGLQGEILRTTARDWLFQFHNNVRIMKNQTPMTMEEYVLLSMSISKSDYAFFVQTVASSIRQGVVRIDNWRKWYSNSERLRIIAGNVVI